MIVGEEKPPLSELAHFGVKGMRWGVRKNDHPLNAGYSDRMRREDRRQHGKRAVARINKRMNDGETREKALEREVDRNTRQRLALAGATYAAFLMAQYGSSHVIARAEANRQVVKTVGIGSTAAPLKYIKPNRSGVHKITTMR